MDTTPLPTVTAPPYICDHIPKQAVERMTGLHNPLTQGYFNLSGSEGYGYGSCMIYEPAGEKWKVMEVKLIPMAPERDVDEEVRLGAKRLPRIVADADGYYFPIENSKGSDHEGYTAAQAVLVREKAQLIIILIRGPQGRDPGADAVALMKLIGPELIIAAAPPSPSPAKKG
ncbi:hypothetical protein GCM10009555_086840 [Acrocarpospora macrocephala]|uniref:DUF3558 domain-containing protein n=1 Tax=Acrocarpospora macrocephala TaxID=150177 RepID=A0A5M3WLH0_9ACTN|nr:hypothetical protein [Acrocarpospora macrocephala]GES08882.1 hypothetical protein Amac_024780 [Acrocarpospora macrocephala]